jgi:hypothetical protein
VIVVGGTPEPTVTENGVAGSPDVVVTLPVTDSAPEERVYPSEHRTHIVSDYRTHEL